MNLVEIVDRSLPRMDDLFAEFPTHGKASKVRGGFYVIQGRYANLAHDYELMPQLTDGYINVEDDESIQIKEGVIASAVSDPASRIGARTLYDDPRAPACFREFIQAFMSDLSDLDRATVRSDLENC